MDVDKVPTIKSTLGKCNGTAKSPSDTLMLVHAGAGSELIRANFLF